MPALLPIIRLARFGVNTLRLGSASLHLATSSMKPSVSMVVADERRGVEGRCDGSASYGAPSDSPSVDNSLWASMS